MNAPETMTVLRAPRRRLAKLLHPDGRIEGYDRARTFDVFALPVPDLDALRAKLAGLLHRPDCCAVRGAPLDPARLGELAAGLVVTLDGEEAARALTGEDATDPEAALADLVATARERGMVLPKGSVISTGTVSKPFDVAAPSAEVRARFLGVELGFRTRVGRGNAA